MGLEAFPPGLKVLRFSACPLLDSGAFMECVGFRIQRVGGFVFFFFLRSWEATSCGHSIQSIRALGNVVAMT